MIYTGETMNNKCFGLVRVSSEKQSTNTSLEHQKNSIEKYCNYHNIELVDVIEEIYSGVKTDRNSISTLKELVLNKQCNQIIVMKIDRLMRSFSEGVVFIKFLLDNDVKIISVSEEINTDTVSGKFYVNLLLSLSELERNTIVERLDTGKLNNFRNNKRYSGRVCFGYKKSNNELIIDDNEKKIVKYIFKKYSELNRLDISQTKKTQRLLKLLKKNDYKYRGKDFKSHQVKYILQNEFYVGVMKYKEERTKHNYDTIVSQRLFNLVN